jgi:hypothetical protein
MKLFLAGLTALALCAQNAPVDQLKHLPIATAGGQPVAVAAMEIERGTGYPTIVHLKGSVEIRMRVCVRTGPGNTQVCDGYMILHADEADFHEDTEQIEARGNVSVTRQY